MLYRDLTAKRWVLRKRLQDKSGKNGVRGDDLEGKSHGTLLSCLRRAGELTLATIPTQFRRGTLTT